MMVAKERSRVLTWQLLRVQEEVDRGQDEVFRLPYLAIERGAVWLLACPQPHQQQQQQKQQSTHSHTHQQRTQTELAELCRVYISCGGPTHPHYNTLSFQTGQPMNLIKVS